MSDPQKRDVASKSAPLTETDQKLIEPLLKLIEERGVLGTPDEARKIIERAYKDLRKSPDVTPEEGRNIIQALREKVWGSADDRYDLFKKYGDHETDHPTERAQKVLDTINHATSSPFFWPVKLKDKIYKAGGEPLHVYENYDTGIIEVVTAAPPAKQNNVAEAMKTLGERLKANGISCELDTEFDRCACLEPRRIALKCGPPSR